MGGCSLIGSKRTLSSQYGDHQNRSSRFVQNQVSENMINNDSLYVLLIFFFYLRWKHQFLVTQYIMNSKHWCWNKGLMKIPSMSIFRLIQVKTESNCMSFERYFQTRWINLMIRCFSLLFLASHLDGRVTRKWHRFRRVKR